MSRPATDHPPTPEPIAIIGIGCRLPGGANSPAAFWRLLCDGVDAVAEVPAERFDAAAVYDPRPATPGRTVARRGGFLDQVDRFDPYFFRIAPREAALMDPQQRLLLETAWEAIEDAGVRPSTLAGSPTGVFVGMCYNDYEDLMGDDPDRIESVYASTGGFRSVASGRISFALGLEGPSVSVDAACSSSLVAVHLAVQSLRAGECVQALAAGANLILHPQISIGFSQGKMLSPDGRCKFGDASADGFVRSEAVGVVLLKPLAAALRDGNPVYALIRGSASNNDGQGSGFLMTPSQQGQEAVLRAAYRDARLDPALVQYVEAHGTGTLVGDRVELNALAAVVGAGRPRGARFLVGSAKTNVGHAEGAAGIVGLIKTTLALHHRAIPPSLHFHTPSPNIAWDELPLAIAQALQPWPTGDGPARAGVSSFGISATNAHVVLEQAPPEAAPRPAPADATPHLLALSAHTPEALAAQARAFQALLRQPDALELADLCYTAGARRDHHDQRLALVARDKAGLDALLQAFLEGERRPGMAQGQIHSAGAVVREEPGRRRPLVLVFAGQGAQWVGMGQRLLDQEPLFLAALERCDQALRPYTGWSLLAELTAPAERSRLTQAEVAWPALFAMQIGLAALWRAWGVQPDAVIGHSIGEVAAAHVAGILSLEDAARVIAALARLVQRTAGQGTMAIVELTPEQAAAEIAGRPGGLELAIFSSPGSVVIAGAPAAVQAYVAELRQRQVFCSLIRTEVAAHSAQMQPLLPELAQALADLRPQPATIPFFSTVTDARVAGPELDAAYWCRNLREPVRFGPLIGALLEQAPHSFLELGPHPVVLPSIKDCASRAGRTVTVLPSLRRDAPGREQMLETLAALEQQGQRVAWGRVLGAPPEKRAGPPRVVFVFPGQGSQWPGMARELLQTEPVFAATIARCDAAIGRFCDWSLLEQLQAAPEHARLEQIDVIQPALFAIEVALAALWRAWGIQPDAVVGHSMGEVAAAHVAGILSLEDAARIICRRSQLLRQTSGQGAMAMVELPLDAAAAALAGYEDRLSIAVSNSPTSTVISGDPRALEQVLAALRARDVFCRPVKVDVASHSPQMDPLRPQLLAALEGLQPRPASTPLVSTVTGRLAAGSSMDPTYWMHNLRQPVLFASACQRLMDDGHSVFVEMSPHPILLPAIQQCLRAFGHTGSALPSLRREEPEQQVLRESLAALFALGCAVDWAALEPHGRVMRLPGYPWQRERFWLERGPAAPARRTARAGNGHPLLGQPGVSSLHPGTLFWDLELDAETLAFLPDHRVRGTPVFPATGYVELALAAATAACGPGPHQVEQFAFRTALFLPAGQARALQVVLAPDSPGSLSFRLSSRPAGAASTAEWTLHGEGRVRLASPATPAPPHQPAPAALRDGCPEPVDGPAHYAAMQQRGLQYGPSFQGVERLWRGARAALAQLRLTELVAPQLAQYQAHPALLDACFQVAVALVGEADRDTYLPVGLERLAVYARPTPEQALWGYALAREVPGAGLARSDVLLLDAEGRVLVEARGLDLQRVEPEARAETADWWYQLGWQPAERPAPAEQPRATWLILADRSGLAVRLRERLEARGDVCVVLAADGLDPADPAALAPTLATLAQAQPACRQVLHLWGLDAAPLDAADAAELDRGVRLGSSSVAALVRGLAGWPSAPRLWIVTRGAQVAAPGETPAVTQAPVLGLGRVLAGEQPELRCTRVDLGPADDPAELEGLLAELLADSPEEEIALRGPARLVARLARWHPPAQPAAPALVPAAGQPFRVYNRTPGVLDGLVARAAPRRQPGPGQVEIAVQASGLNFMNLLGALGIYPGQPMLGIECAGTVCALGPGVAGWRVGDRVVAIVSDGDGLASHVCTDARLLAPAPQTLGLDEAAGVPITYVTVHYALRELARLRAGERVLIHSAAGGVGLVALQIAQALGAEIFATAGSPEKRALLQSLGVRHVFDSRSLDFAAQIMQITGGQGVDVVLNSLSGAALVKSFETLRPLGRFVELGKTDIYQNSQLGMYAFRNNLALFAVDLVQIWRERPELAGAMLREVVAQLDAGTLRPVPTTVFPVSQVAAAFRHMAQARHTGKICIRMDDPQLRIEPAPGRLRPDATYLITGGLGGLGLALAGRLAQRGARHLVLAGRSAPSPEAQAQIAALEAAGAQVRTARADVAQAQDLATLLAQIQDMPPLRGVIHAAGLLDDGLLTQLDHSRFQRVMAPKLLGAWNLHRLTHGLELDMFVLFSSVAALVGSPGQANYAAANAFLDALAEARRAQGLPAVSIAWGPWSEIGLAAARADRGERLAQRGLGSLTPAQGLDAFEQVLAWDPPRIAVAPFDARLWRQSYRRSGPAPLLDLLDQAETAAPVAAPSAGVRAALLEAEPGPRRRAVLEAHLREQIAQVLRLAPARIEPHTPLGSLGLDSLTALEIRNRLEGSLSLSISSTLLWNYPNIAVLAPHLAERLGIPLDAPAEAAPAPLPDPAAPAPEELDDFSEDELAALLAEQLARLQEKH